MATGFGLKTREMGNFFRKLLAPTLAPRLENKEKNQIFLNIYFNTKMLSLVIHAGYEDGKNAFCNNRLSV